jgi:hypothetical protein
MEQPGTSPQGVISDQNEILEELFKSKSNENLLGLWFSGKRPEMLVCSVEEIRDGKAENDKVIIVHEKDLQGKILSTHVLYLKEIVKLHRFKKNR